MDGVDGDPRACRVAIGLDCMGCMGCEDGDVAIAVCLVVMCEVEGGGGGVLVCSIILVLTISTYNAGKKPIFPAEFLPATHSVS